MKKIIRAILNMVYRHSSLIDRLFIFFIVVWVMVLITLNVAFLKLNVISNNQELTPETKAQINQIYIWCEDAFSPAKEK